MSVNSNIYFNLKKKLEEAEDDLKYSTDDIVRYYSEKLKEIADEMLKYLAAEWLSNEVYSEEYPEEEEDDEFLSN